MLSEYLLWLGIAALIVLICLLVRWWNRWEQKRSLERKRKLEEASDLRWEKIQQENRLREERELEDQRRSEEVMDHIQSLILRLQEIHRKAVQREAMRRMPRKAREARRRVPTRNRYPLAAGHRARNQEWDREWKERNSQPTMQRKTIATVGPFRLSKLSRIR